MKAVSAWTMPLLLCALSMLFLCSRRELFASFTAGAKEGMRTATGLLPTLCALLVGVSVFRASGACEWLTDLLAPLCQRIGIPKELLPLLTVRPFSGGASTAVAEDLFAAEGADSFAGRVASVLLGSSDTVFYIVAVYFGAVGIKRGRHTLVAALLTAGFCTVLACAITRMFFD